MTRKFPKEEKYGLLSQIRRAAFSATVNITEEFGRFHFADKVRSYHQARGSVKEMQNFLFLTQALGYLNRESAKEALETSKARRKTNQWPDKIH